jgi:hypothetical protein
MTEHGSGSEPVVEPTYRVLDDRVEDPDAFAHDPSAEATHVPEPMADERREHW